jgi:hypothetical protein
MDTSDVLAQVQGQLIAVTNICAILLATHPDADELIPIVRNLAAAERSGDSAQDKEICAGIANVLSRVEVILSASEHEDVSSEQTKEFLKTN